MTNKKQNIRHIESESKIIIEGIYKDYKKFMCTSDLPEYKLNFQNSNGMNLANYNYVNGEHNLLITDTLFTNYNKIAKSVLYHEFTHLFDRVELVGKYGFTHDRVADFYAYTEYHASQIKMMYCLGFNMPYENRKIDPEQLVMSNSGKMISFYEYLIGQKESAIKDIDVLKFGDFKNLNHYINSFLYYIGEVSVYMKYCDFNTEEILNISGFTATLGSELEVIKTELLKIWDNNIDKNKIKNIGDIHLQLMDKWVLVTKAFS